VSDKMSGRGPECRIVFADWLVGLIVLWLPSSGPCFGGEPTCYWEGETNFLGYI